MHWSEEYSSEIAFWHALRRQASAQTTASRIEQQETLRMFVMERFLTRMFQTATPPWIVAGGTNLLIRVPGMRGTRDIDLNTSSENYGSVQEIRADLESFSGDSPLDPFSYRIDRKVGTFTGGLQGSTWKVTATIGEQRAAVFGLDLAADDTTAPSDIEHLAVTPAISGMRGLTAPPPVPMYPLAAQIADKISSVCYRDEHGRSTGRYRDLVDLAIYAGYVDVDADKLRNALAQRGANRGRAVPERISIDEDWAAGYGKTAAVTNLPSGLLDITAATEAVAAWLDPLLRGDLPEASIWDHHSGAWRSADDAPSKPGRVWVRPHTRRDGGQPVVDYYRRSPRNR
jgi:hypothetical protein